MQTNQGPSSTQDNVVKKACYIPMTENLAGDQSDLSTTAGLGTTAGKSGDSVEYAVKDVNQLNGTAQPYLNIPFNETDQRSPRSKGMVSQDIPADGRNQYQ